MANNEQKFNPHARAMPWLGDNLAELEAWLVEYIPGATVVMQDGALIYTAPGAPFGMPFPLGRYVMVFMGAVSFQTEESINLMRDA